MNSSKLNHLRKMHRDKLKSFGKRKRLYCSEAIVARIKLYAENQEIKINSMLSALGLIGNNLSDVFKNHPIPLVTLIKIADYMNVSMDFLLGRNDIPALTSDDLKSNEAKSRLELINFASTASEEETILMSSVYRAVEAFVDDQDISESTDEE